MNADPISMSQRKQLEATAWLAVVRAYQQCTKRYAEMLERLELTIPQFDVLSAIAKLGEEATPKAIADELIVTRGNVSGVLRRLQSSGLIRTRDNESDGRSFVCELTAAGQRRLARARSAAASFIEQQLAPFDEETLLDTKATMERMAAHLSTISVDAVLAATTGHRR